MFENIENVFYCTVRAISKRPQRRRQPRPSGLLAGLDCWSVFESQRTLTLWRGTPDSKEVKEPFGRDSARVRIGTQNTMAWVSSDRPKFGSWTIMSFQYSAEISLNLILIKPVL